MFCKPSSLSRNRSLRDAKSARHMFVWFAKHCLAEHCLLFRGDADECQKQFCFVFRICLAFFDSRLWRPLHAAPHVDRICYESHDLTSHSHKACAGPCFKNNLTTNRNRISSFYIKLRRRLRFVVRLFWNHGLIGQQKVSGAALEFWRFVVDYEWICQVINDNDIL